MAIIPFAYTKNEGEYDEEIHTTITHRRHPRHRKEEPRNTNSHKTSGRQLKQSNQLSLPRN